MQCYTPMIRYYQIASREEKEAIKSQDKKLTQKIIPREVVLRQLKHDENYLTGLKRLNEENENKGIRWRYQAIPCRHCYACSLNYAAQWASRLAAEASYYEQNYFITITYNDMFLPIPEKVYYGETDDAYFENDGTWDGTLVKKDIQDFKDRLRKHLEYRGKLGNFKFFYCGEYGGETQRPHYHMIVTDCQLDESQFYDCHIDENHNDVWKSHELDELWSYKKNKRDKEYICKGFVEIANATWQDMAYVARYTAKKAFKTSDDWEYFTRGKIPEFISMSKGIGDKYFLENLDKIYETDEMIQKTVKGKTSHVKPGKRCDQLLEKINPEKFDQVKAHREEITKMIDSMIKKNTDMTDLERLRLQEEKITTKAKMLKREMKTRN